MSCNRPLNSLVLRPFNSSVTSIPHNTLEGTDGARQLYSTRPTGANRNHQTRQDIHEDQFLWIGSTYVGIYMQLNPRLSFSFRLMTNGLRVKLKLSTCWD